MELLTHHYSKSLRRAYERSISEQNYENHHHFTEKNIFLKGQNQQNFLKERSYQIENSSSYEENLIAKDLRVNKSNNSNDQLLHQRDSPRVNGICSNRIKEEEERGEQMTSIRRYFCIFCKMDFSNADVFLDHLELHTNGSFVLVKRDFISIPQQLSPKNNTSCNNNNSNNNDNNNVSVNNKTTNNNISNSHLLSERGSSVLSAVIAENKYENPTKNNKIIHNNNNNSTSSCNNIILSKTESLEETTPLTASIEEEISNLPIVPEVLKNQIKIEPISEDEEEEDVEHNNNNINSNNNNFNSHIINDNNNHRTSELNSQHYNDEHIRNVNSSSPVHDNNNSTETGDPNQQLLVLSNPRIGDGPGEYLCNVCHAKFVYKNNLKSHLKRHLGIYPYVCFCGKRYQFKCKLNKHIEQAHAKIKNFKCPVPTCPKKYFTRNDLAFHISVTHQERQEIPCNICQKVFNSQKSLQIHCRKYHRNQEA